MGCDGMVFSAQCCVLKCVVNPSIYRRNLGSLDAILALDMKLKTL
jgi:hypothetical protein